MELASSVMEKLKNEKGIHADTAVAAASRMAGTFLLRSFRLPLDGMTPGAPVLSELANERGPALVATLGETLNGFKVPIDASRVSPGLSPELQLDVPGTHALLDGEFIRVGNKYRFTDLELAHAAAIAAGVLIWKAASSLDPTIAFGIAAYGFVEGAKTVPPTINVGERLARPWYKFW